MASLEKMVTRQRDTLMARSHDIHRQAERIHTRLRHPAVLIPAFLGGVLVTRRAPALLRALSGLTARMSRFSNELSRFHAIVRLITSLAPSEPSGRKCGHEEGASE